MQYAGKRFAFTSVVEGSASLFTSFVRLEETHLQQQPVVSIDPAVTHLIYVNS